MNNTRGGSGKGQGRKHLPIEQRTVVVTIRLTPARKDKLRLLGAKWLSITLDSINTEKN